MWCLVAVTVDVGVMRLVCCRHKFVKRLTRLNALCCPLQSVSGGCAASRNLDDSTPGFARFSNRKMF